MKKIIYCLLMLAVSGPVLLVTNATAGAKLWEKKLSGKITWKQLHAAGVILAITDDELLYGLDPKTGNEIYKLDHLSRNPDPFNPEAPSGTPCILQGTPYLLVATKAGMTKPEALKLVNAVDGKIVWEAALNVPAVQVEAISEGKKFEGDLVFTHGSMMRPTYDAAHNQVIFFSFGASVMTKKYKVFKKGAIFAGIDVATGKTNFIYFSPEQIKDDSVVDSPVTVSGDTALVDWFGMHSFSVLDGKPLGAVKFKRAIKAGLIGGMPYQHTNSPSVIEGDIAFIVAKERIEAYDIKTGLKKWESEDLDVAIPQLLLSGDKLVAKMGGIFCTGQTWKTKAQCKEFYPYGIAVLDKNTGKILGKTGDIDKKNGKALTSALTLSNNVVYHAVSNGARAFDLNAMNYKWMTAISKNAEDGDDPKLVEVADGKLLMLNTQVTAAYNLADGKLLWSQVVPPVKMDLAMKMVMAFASVAAYASGVEAGKQGGVMNQQQTVDRWASTDAGFASMMKQVSLADASGRYNYSMTGKSKNAVIAGVNTKTGKLDRGTQVEGRVPDYMVDKVTGILVNVSQSDPKWIMGFNMGAPLPELN